MDKDFLNRMLQLGARESKIKAQWATYSHFYPIKALFIIRRFNRVLRKIYELKKIEYKKRGYYD